MTSAQSRDAQILIVDDEPANIALLERTLSGAGYTRLLSTTDPERAVHLFQAAEPDLLLLDLHMPRIDGFGVLDAIKHLDMPGPVVPVLVLTADVTLEARRRALGSGAHDFVIKPFDLVEVLLRVGNLLKTRATERTLTDELEMQSGDARRARVETLERLAVAAEFRDDETGAHIERVGLMTGRLAIAIGLSETDATLFAQAARLHDLGKIGVPDGVLMKAGPLSDDEWVVMRSHTKIGAEILRGSESPIVRTAAEVAASHHERWDGHGYPARLAGEHIPLAARLTSIADAFDAMTTDRRYRPRRSTDEAIAEIERHAGTQFDPSMTRYLPGCVTDVAAALG